MDTGSQTPGNWTTWLVIGLLMAPIFFAYPLFLGIPLIDPDEGLHAAIAQEMAERGDWITPRFVGEPFLDKPVLFTWCQAASLRAFGMSEAAVRLPGMFFGLLGVVTTGLVAWRLFSPSVGTMAAAMYSVAVLPVALTQVPAHDVALVPWTNLAILLFWEAERTESRRGMVWAVAGAGCVLGLACLTKGLMGFAIAGVAMGGYVVITRRLTWATCIRAALALSLAVAIAAGWYIAMELRNPGYLYYYFVDRHLLGYATSSQRHADEAWWFYLPILLFGGLPWTLYLPSAFADWWTRARRHGEDCGTAEERGTASNGTTLVLCWLVGNTLLLTLAGSKLVTYIWPVLPALVIVVAVLWNRILNRQVAPPVEQITTATFHLASLTGPFLLPLALAVAAAVLDVRFSAASWVLAIAAGMTCLAPLALWRAQRRTAGLAAGILCIAPQFAVALAVIGPPAAAVNSAPDLARHINRLGRLPEQLVVVEDRIGSLVFYLDPRLRAELKPDQLLTVRPYRMPEWSTSRHDTLVAVAKWTLPEAEEYFRFPPSGFLTAGRYRVYTAAELGLVFPGSNVANGQPISQAARSTAAHTPRTGAASTHLPPR
ncbi:MAG: glycosyltransferase family 39 protein [Thermoguttaceae bacterium]|nr:glycosyltransferase family 39 protein [Thermoguttaceae bacterium]